MEIEDVYKHVLTLQVISGIVKGERVKYDLWLPFSADESLTSSYCSTLVSIYRMLPRRLLYLIMVNVSISCNHYPLFNSGL